MSHMSEKAIDEMNKIKEQTAMIKNKIIVGLLCLLVVLCGVVSYWMTTPIGDDYPWMRNVLTVIITVFFLGVAVLMDRFLNKENK